MQIWWAGGGFASEAGQGADMVMKGSSDLNDEGVQLDSSHDVAPGGIHLPERAAFLGDLLHDFL